MLLSLILDRCTEFGECWLWDGPLSGGTSPQVFFQGKYHSCRRAIFREVIGPVPDGLNLVMKCREDRCLNADHMSPMTVAEVAQLASLEGRFSTPSRRAAIAKGKRASPSAKLTHAKAAAIRECRTAQEAAAIYGIHKSMASRIRRGEAWAEVSGASAFTFRP